MSKAFKTIKSGSVKIPIYRNKHPHAAGGWVFTASYYIDGRRRQKQGTSLDAIEAEAKRIAGNLSAGKAEAAEFSTNDREELLAARRICGDVPLLATLHEIKLAKELTGNNLLVAARAWADSANRNFKPRLTKDVIDEYLDLKTRGGSGIAKSHASAFRNIRCELGDRYIHELEAAELDRYLQMRPDPWTAMTYRKRIVAVSRWAQRYGYVPRNGQTAAECTQLPSTPEAKIGIMTPDCFRRLLRLVSEKSSRDVPALILAGMCGLRRNEVHSQLWEHINLDEKILTVSSAKKGTFSYRRVPLCDAAVAWLRGFAGRDGRVCEGLSIDRIRKLGREAGLELKDNALRHSFVSYRVEQVKSRGQVALEAGHSEDILTKHYREIVSPTDAAAWFGVLPVAAIGTDPESSH
jgi:integrase